VEAEDGAEVVAEEDSAVLVEVVLAAVVQAEAGKHKFMLNWNALLQGHF